MDKSHLNPNLTNLTSLVNYEDIEIVDYDHFMDENTNNNYSQKYSFLSDYHTSFKGSFKGSFLGTKPQIKPNIHNNNKYSFESTASLRISNEIADIFKENLFTNNSLIGSLFEFLSTHHSLLKLLRTSDLDYYYPLLGLRFKTSRNDVLELEKDFSLIGKLETLRKVLFEEKAFNGKELNPNFKANTKEQIKLAFRVLLLKVLLELSCLLFIKEDFSVFQRLESNLDIGFYKKDCILNGFSQITRDNFLGIYTKEFKLDLTELNTITGFSKGIIEKAQRFKSFFNSQKVLSPIIKDLPALFQDLILIYEGFERQLKEKIGLLNEDFIGDWEEERLFMRGLCEGYLDKEKGLELLLKGAFGELGNVLKKEPLVKDLVNFNGKINKINLIYRKVYNYSVEKPLVYITQLKALESFPDLKEKPSLEIENQFFIDRYYEINRIKTDIKKIKSEIRAYKREKVPNNEFSMVLIGVLDETEEVYKGFLAKLAWAQRELDYYKGVLIEKGDFQRNGKEIMEKELVLLKKQEGNPPLEVNEFLKRLTALTVMNQEGQLIIKKSKFLEINEGDISKIVDWGYERLDNLIANFQGIKFY